MNEEKIKFKAIKASDGYFIKLESRYPVALEGKFKFNGEEPRATHKQYWYKVSSIIKPERITPKTRTIRGYHLKKQYTSTEEMPAKVQKDFFGSDVYEHELFNLYEAVHDEVPEKSESIQIEVETIAEVEGDIVEHKMAIPVYGDYAHKGKTYTISNTNIKISLIDELVTPDLLKESLPCRLPSEESYKIIRSHIKDNIDPKVAIISSDYEFCLTVKKRIPAAKETIDKRNVREVQVFETSPLRNGKPYNNYTATKPFEGKNAKDLEENIEKYLKELMVEINRPYVDCETCKGMGVLMAKK